MPEIKISAKQALLFSQHQQALQSIAQVLMLSEGVPENATFAGIEGATLTYTVPDEKAKK